MQLKQWKMKFEVLCAVVGKKKPGDFKPEYIIKAREMIASNYRKKRLYLRCFDIQGMLAQELYYAWSKNLAFILCWPDRPALEMIMILMPPKEIRYFLMWN